MRSPFADISEIQTEDEAGSLEHSDLERESPFLSQEDFSSETEEELPAETYETDREQEGIAMEEEMISGEEETIPGGELEEENISAENEAQQNFTQEMLDEYETSENESASYGINEWEEEGTAETLENEGGSEKSSLGTTLYIGADLKIKNAKAKTGIFVPASFIASDSFELIIYLHGYKYDTSKGPTVCYNGICPDSTVEEYWKNQMFLLREAVVDKRRNSILVVPTLGLRSEAGSLQLERGFDLFVSQIIRALLCEKIIDGCQLPGRIILAAHSGGGAPMLRIASLPDQYSRLIKEIWCYDCLYGSVAVAWSNWIKKDPERKFYSYYFGSGPTQQSLEIKRLCSREAARVFVKATEIRNHWNMVLPYWKERCGGANGKPAVKKESFESYSPESEDEWGEMESETAEPGDPSSQYHSSRLPADNNPSLDRFKRKVYDICIRNSQARAKKGERIFIDDLPGFQKFPKVDGQPVHPAMLDSLQKLIQAASAAAVTRGDQVKIKVASGYRPTSGQFRTWNARFYQYYDRGINGYFKTVRGQKTYIKPFLGKNDYSDEAAQKLARYIGALFASPGYSNHNNGRAVDFGITGTEKHGGKLLRVSLGPSSAQTSAWQNSNFWNWLKVNAAGFEFREYIVEPWHWDFTGRRKEEGETLYEEEIIFPETEEPLSRLELLEEGEMENEDGPKTRNTKNIKLTGKQAPLYFVGIDVTESIDTVAWGHLWNQKFGWRNLLWELEKDKSDNQRRVDKAHKNLPIARLIRKQDGVTFSDTVILPQGVDAKGKDKLWSGTTSFDNNAEMDSTCAFMQSFILNPSADKSTSSLNDSGTGVTASVVYLSSHGLSTGEMFGEGGNAEPLFAPVKSVSLGAQFAGVGWLLLSNCSTLKPHTHEDWLKLMRGPVPLRGIVGFQDTCPLASGSVKVFSSFIKRLAEGRTFIESWSQGLAVRGLEDAWIVLCQEDAVSDTISDFNSRTLKPTRTGGKILMFNKANPTGVEVVPVPDPFEAFWSKGGARITPFNRSAKKLTVGDKVRITIRPPLPATEFVNGTAVSVAVIYVRTNYPQAMDTTKIFTLKSFSGVGKPTDADINPDNPKGFDGWRMVVSGTPKEVVLDLECKDLTGFHPNYIFWLQVAIASTSHDFVHNGSITIG